MAAASGSGSRVAFTDVQKTGAVTVVSQSTKQGDWLTASCACMAVAGFFDTTANRTWLKTWVRTHAKHKAPTSRR